MFWKNPDIKDYVLPDYIKFDYRQNYPLVQGVRVEASLRKAEAVTGGLRMASRCC